MTEESKDEEPEHALNESNLVDPNPDDDALDDDSIASLVETSDDNSSIVEPLNEEDHEFLNQLLDQLHDEDSPSGPNETYEIEDLEELETNWWPSSDQLKEMEIPEDVNYKIPDPTEWKDTEGPVHVCVDRARREAWEQCKREVYALRANVMKIPDIQAAVDDTAFNKKVLGLLMGNHGTP